MNFPMVALGEVIKHRNQFIQIDDLENYKRCRVQLHAQGIVLRDIVLGAEIKTKKQQVCRTGEFLVAEIDAKIGGFGIVPSELDGAIVSSHYFLFVTDEIRLDRRFLDFFIRTPYFREQVKAQGSTNYAAIRPSDVLGYKIPLPPLPEQSLIVGRIEELAAKIEEARGLRMKAGEEAKVLFMSSLGTTMESFYNEFQIKAVENLCEQVVDCKHYTPRYCDDGRYPAIRTSEIHFGWIDIKSAKKVDEVDFEHMTNQYKPNRNDVLYAREGNWGNAGIIEVDDPIAISQRVMLFSPDTKQIEPKFLMCVLNSPQVRKLASEKKRGYTAIHINVADAKKFPIPLPPLPEQRRIVAYLDELQAKVDALRRLQADTSAELDALLPTVLDRAFKGEL